VIKDSSETTSVGQKHYLEPEIEMWNILASNCVGTPQGSSLLGKSILEANNEVHLIYLTDTLHLPNHVSDSAFSNFEGVQFYIKLDSIYYKNINNQLADSVKSYSFHLQPFSGLYWCVKDGVIEISKHNGLISFPGCFKNYLPGYGNTIGQTTAGNVAPLTLAEIYNVHIGDEFHYNYDQSFSSSHHKTGIDNCKIISLNPLKIWRLYERKNQSGPNISIWSGSDTISSFTISQNPQFPCFDCPTNRIVDTNNYLVNYQVRSKSYLTTDSATIGTIFCTPILDTCLWPLIGDWSFDHIVFAKGLACVSELFSSSTQGNIEYESRSLFYFKKGNYSWGIPKYVGIEDLYLENINIFPNPTTDFLTISGLQNKTVSWQIIDLSGRELKRGFANEENTEIDVRDFAAGVYFLILENQKAIKFIKK
jgi:hypothetical protein